MVTVNNKLFTISDEDSFYPSLYMAEEFLVTTKNTFGRDLFIFNISYIYNKQSSALYKRGCTEQSLL